MVFSGLLFLLAFFMLLFGMMLDVDSSPSTGGGMLFIIGAVVVFMCANIVI